MDRNTYQLIEEAVRKYLTDRAIEVPQERLDSIIVELKSCENTKE
ncbi:MAG: hypothetical protein ACK4ZR_06295 [Aquificaceae bacterium]